MLHQLDSAQFRATASCGDVSSLLATLNPQQGDDHVTLLAKIAAALADIKSRTQLCGVVIDPGGLPQAVRNVFEDVAANETYEELVAQPVAKRIAILGLFALGGATGTTITLYSKIDSGSAVQAGPTMANAANGGEVLPISNHPWLILPAGAALGCSTSNHAATGVIVVYYLMPNYATIDGLVQTIDGVPQILPA